MTGDGPITLVIPHLVEFDLRHPALHLDPAVGRRAAVRTAVNLTRLEA